MVVRVPAARFARGIIHQLRLHFSIKKSILWVVDDFYASYENEALIIKILKLQAYIHQDDRLKISFLMTFGINYIQSTWLWLVLFILLKSFLMVDLENTREKI